MPKIVVIKVIFANKNRHKMKTPPPISVRSGLKKLGLALKKARLRRRLPMELVSDRAGISRETLSKIQNGLLSVKYPYCLAFLPLLALHKIRLSAWSMANFAGLCHWMGAAIYARLILRRG